MVYTCRVLFVAVFVIFFVSSNSFASSDFLKEYNDKILGKNYYGQVKEQKASKGSDGASVSLNDTSSLKNDKPAETDVDKKKMAEGAEPSPKKDSIEAMKPLASSGEAKEDDESRIDSIDTYNAAILAKNYYNSPLLRDPSDASPVEKKSAVGTSVSVGQKAKAPEVCINKAESPIEPIEPEGESKKNTIAQYSDSNENDAASVVEKKRVKPDKLSQIRKEKELLKKRLGIE